MKKVVDYWWFITKPENWKIVKENCIYGSHSMRTIEKVKKGDEIVMYASNKRIGGLYEAEGEVYEDKKRSLFSFLYRIKLKPIIVPKKELELTEELIRELDFFDNPDKWFYKIGGKSILKASKNDFDYLYKKMKRL